MRNEKIKVNPTAYHSTRSITHRYIARIIFYQYYTKRNIFKDL